MVKGFETHLVLYNIILTNDFFVCFDFVAKCTRHHHGRRAGVCHTTHDHRQAALRSGRQNDRPARSLVLWPAVHRFKG